MHSFGGVLQIGYLAKWQKQREGRGFGSRKGFFFFFLSCLFVSMDS